MTPLQLCWDRQSFLSLLFDPDWENTLCLLPRLLYETESEADPQNFPIIIISFTAFAEGNVTIWVPFVLSKSTLAVPHLCVTTQPPANCAIISLRIFQEPKLDGSTIPQYFPLPFLKRRVLCLIFPIILLLQRPLKYN